MGYRFPSEHGLLAMLIFAVATMVFAMFAIYALLLQMEYQKSLSFFVDEKLDLEEEDDNTKGGESDAEKQKKNEQVTARYRVSKMRRVILFSTVSLITLLTYLLLVRTDAPSWLAWIGMGAILMVLLNTYLMDEIRRKRFDRLFSILTMILVMAMAMHWTVYAQQQVANGQIHQGTARITGYDRTAYDQTKGEEGVSRTDLVVAWGGSWGCPSSPDIFCEAELKGALCETGKDRFLEQANDVKEVENAEAAAEEIVDEDAASGENVDSGANSNNVDAEQNEAGNDGGEGDAAAENNMEQLEQENEELREENYGYKEEAEAYEDYAEELTEALEDEYAKEYTYYYDDDYYEDSYWDTQDWNSIWGDYACVDVFTFENFDNGLYNATTPPGDDGWPFVNIYGNCKTCEAYIIDYFSTAHFEEIESRKKSARNYGLAAGLSLVITIIFAIKQRISPATDNEIELLSRHGTTSFA